MTLAEARDRARATNDRVLLSKLDGMPEGTILEPFLEGYLPITPPSEGPPPVAARPEPKRAVVSVLLYPRQAPEGLANDAIDIELEDVRAARGIRVQYDFDRDGFVISAQPDPGESGPSAGEHDQRFFEVAFVPAWAPAAPQQPPGVASEPTPLEQAAAVIEQATAEPMGTPWVGARQVSPDSPRTLLIGSERDAAEAFGEDSDLHRHVRSFFARPRAEPVVLVRLEPELAPLRRCAECGRETEYELCAYCADPEDRDG